MGKLLASAATRHGSGRFVTSHGTQALQKLSFVLICRLLAIVDSADCEYTISDQTVRKLLGVAAGDFVKNPSDLKFEELMGRTFNFFVQGSSIIDVDDQLQA